MADRPEFGTFVKLIRDAEESLRWAVDEVLSARCGKDWWPARAAPLLPRLHNEWVTYSRRHGGKADWEPWQRLKVSDIRRILTGTAGGIDNWPLFEPIFHRSRDEVSRVLKHINQLRGEIVHPETDWDSLRLERISGAVKECQWMMGCVSALPGRRHYEEIGELLGRMELAGLVERRPIDSGPARWGLTPRSDELLAAAVEKRLQTATKTDTEEAIITDAIGMLMLGEFGVARRPEGEFPLELPEDVLLPYIQAFMALLSKDSVRFAGLVALLQHLRSGG